MSITITTIRLIKNKIVKYRAEKVCSDRKNHNFFSQIKYVK